MTDEEDFDERLRRYVEGGCTCEYCQLCRTPVAWRRYDQHHAGIPSYPDPRDYG